MKEYTIKAANIEEAMIGLKWYNYYSFHEGGSVIQSEMIGNEIKDFEIDWQLSATGVSILVVEYIPPTNYDDSPTDPIHGGKIWDGT